MISKFRFRLLTSLFDVVVAFLVVVFYSILGNEFFYF